MTPGRSRPTSWLKESTWWPLSRRGASERDPGIGWGANLEAGERAGPDADDRHQLALQTKGLADHIGVGPEASLPAAETNRRDRRHTVDVVRGQDRPSSGPTPSVSK